MNPVVRGDIVVEQFLNSVGGYRHKERRDRLLDILDVDIDWHMHAISDGERRRVQLCMGLMTPWEILLLDEVRHHVVHKTACLDNPYCMAVKHGRHR
jgi:CCR4-NOT complex subunit CAF16